MKILFFGTSQFAVESLKRLFASGYGVEAVVTQPDRPRGRNLKVTMSPVKEAALEHGVKILQPGELGSDFPAEAASYGADLFVVISYGHILRRELLAVPSKYSVNLHASLLPKYRGAAPINWAIMRGERETGVTVMRMNDRMDEGDILSQARTAIGDEDTSAVLTDRLARMGADLLVTTLEAIEKGGEKFTKQDSAQASYAPKLAKLHGLIDWRKSAPEIHNLVRGTVPWPGAYTRFAGGILKILRTGIAEGMAGDPGEVLAASGEDIVVAAGKGAVRILELQPQAGKKMDSASFLRGHHVRAGTRMQD
ncbi:MAG: methionyl-tRNA formyltransferase [Candidatus Omnitrophota bacterium]